MPRNVFAKEVIAFLKDFSISINHLANVSGISHPALTSIINGATSPRPETVEKIQAGMQLIAQPISKFGQELKLLREQNSLSVSKIAEEAGISAQAIYFIEDGRTRNPSVKTQSLISAALQKLTTETLDVQNSVEITTNTSQDLIELEEFDPYSPASHPEKPGIYILYDVSDRPIYVGQSNNIKGRIKNHEDKFWYKKPIVETAAFITVRDETMRKQIEKILIKFLKSNAVLNKIHAEHQ